LIWFFIRQADVTSQLNVTIAIYYRQGGLLLWLHYRRIL